MKGRAGFRILARKKKQKPDDHLKRENPGNTDPQIYAIIPGHDLAEVVEMVYRYKGKRRKLDHIFVKWPYSPVKRRFQMNPFIKLKKRKKISWYQKAIKKILEDFTHPGR